MSGEEIIDISETLRKDLPIEFLSELAATRKEKIKIIKELFKVIGTKYGKRVAVDSITQEFPHIMTDKGAGRLGYKADPNGSRIFPFYQVEGYRTPEEARAILSAVEDLSPSDREMLETLEKYR